MATKDDTGGQALDIPLPGAAEGFVKIVDIEDDLCIGRGKEPEVSDMGITAKLDFDFGVFGRSQVGSHNLGCTPIEGEQRACHQVELDGQKFGQASPAGLCDDGQ